MPSAKNPCRGDGRRRPHRPGPLFAFISFVSRVDVERNEAKLLTMATDQSTSATPPLATFPSVSSSFLLAVFFLFFVFFFFFFLKSHSIFFLIFFNSRDVRTRFVYPPSNFVLVSNIQLNRSFNSDFLIRSIVSNFHWFQFRFVYFLRLQEFLKYDQLDP